MPVGKVASLDAVREKMTGSGEFCFRDDAQQVRTQGRQVTKGAKGENLDPFDLKMRQFCIVRVIGNSNASGKSNYGRHEEERLWISRT